MSRIQPDVVDLPCVPVTATRRRPRGRGRVGDDLLDALGLDAERAGGHELRVVGVDRGDRLGDRDAVHERPRRRRRGCATGRATTSIGIPAAATAAGQRVRPAGVARGHDRARGGRMDGRAGRRGAAHADHVDPGPGRDRPRRVAAPRGRARSPRRCASPAGDLGGSLGALQERRAAPPRRSRRCSRRGPASTGIAGRRRRPRRRPPRRRARPASRPSRRRARRRR